MKTSRMRLRYLLDRHYNKTATAAERDELFALVETCDYDEDITDLIQANWDNLHAESDTIQEHRSAGILNEILNNDNKKSKGGRTLLLWAKFSAAAVVLVFAGIGLHHFFCRTEVVKKQQTALAKQPQRPLHDALPGSNKAVLTLANGQTIVLDDANNGTLAKEGTTVIKKTADGQVLYNATALTGTKLPPAMNTIATPRGGQYQILLPDGTKVWLNAASSIRFPTYFTGSTREVEMTGEAYFEVTKNAAMPFHVKTSRAEVEVLGTHFNVMAYDDEKVMKTTLLEGAVNIHAGTFNARLRPGQQAQIAPGANKVVDDVDVDDETAWKNGIFQFRDAGVDMILRQAARWYDVDVVYKSRAPDRQFTGRISRNVKASQLFNMLEYTGVDLDIEGRTVVVK